MSHFSKIKTKITDANVLITSLQDLGLVVKTNAIVRGHDSQIISADIVAVVDEEYDLGWSRNSHGYFDLVVDLWGVTVDLLACTYGSDKKYRQAELIECIQKRYAVNITNKMLSNSKLGLKHENVKLLLH